jgi:23S rRNA pseudouridine1911/1915/1917 synthase
MLVHPSTKLEDTTLANAVLYHYQQNQLSLDYHPVHRLDRNTSGLVLIAKYPHIQHYLCHNSLKSVNRFYTAVITGTMPTITGVIDAPIGRSPDSIIRRIVRPDGQQAVTKYRTNTSFGYASILEIELLTGRTHQIRAHFAAVGHPLLGDDLYGGSTTLIGRQALHAAKLVFQHPTSRKTITVTANLPEDFEQLIVHLKQMGNHV